ncbi:MAG: hypothetical protein EXS05_15270 [Planctomycetaceae bacterium]|nr:hypothetical protein [Planctomycetaceae bacterium]
MNCFRFVAFVFLSSFSLHVARSETPVDIGSRRELFVDDALIGSTTGRAELRLHHPAPREVALRYDRAWEGNASGYATIFQDGDLYRMYYRGHRYIVEGKSLRQAQPESVCYAESRDGIEWTKPVLGLFEWQGSKQNNIIWLGGAETHNFAPFKDFSPNCPDDQRYKAVGGTINSGLLAFKSADGIHWSRLSEHAIFTQGVFDSHNTAFWDPVRREYALNYRFFSEGQFKGLRLIGRSHSADFRHWSEPEMLTYPGSPPQQMYTNQIAPYFRAPHILMGFPTRYTARSVSDHLRTLEPVEVRTRLIKADERTGTDLTDGVFMTSRDGLTFRRWDEAFVRPGPQAEGRWIYGDNYQSYGLWETKSDVPGAPREISMHFNEGAWNDELHRVRRYTIRLDGFVSLHAPLSGGEIETKPLTFRGKQLAINYSTSAAGSVRVELQDEQGQSLAGFSLADATELFGDTVEQIVSWKNGPDVSRFSGKPVRLRFVLKDADLYSFRFVE